MRWLVAALVGLLAALGVAASVFHYIEEPYNPGFIEFPVITALHVILGGIYLAFAPFQFVRRIRTRWPGYHRWIGRVLVVLALVSGVTALFMGFVFPAAGWPQSIVIGIFGVFFVTALVLGFVHIRAGRVALHREWMMRAFAIGLAIATTRLIAIPTIIVMGDAIDPGMIVLASFTGAFIIHTLVAELWIRRTRPPGRRPDQAAPPAWQP